MLTCVCVRTNRIISNKFLYLPNGINILSRASMSFFPSPNLGLILFVLFIVPGNTSSSPYTSYTSLRTFPKSCYNFVTSHKIVINLTLCPFVKIYSHAHLFEPERYSHLSL